MSALREIALGSEVIGLLLPHRRPLLMVDGVTAIRVEEPRPAIRAYRHITANEACFDAHFPGHPVWPGIYTQEGLGQTSGVLAAVLIVVASLAAHAVDAEGALEALEQVHAAYRFRPVRDAERTAELVSTIRSAQRAPGVTAGVELKYLAPVFAGDTLVYHAERSRVMGELQRFTVRAEVADREVARGVMTVSFGLPRPAFA